MNAKKLGIVAALAGACVLAARSLAPKLHEHCRRMCAGGKCGGTPEREEPHESPERHCAPQSRRDVELVA
jgi:hypothetical protein